MVLRTLLTLLHKNHTQVLDHIPSSSDPSSSLPTRPPFLLLLLVPHLSPIDTREALALSIYCRLFQAPTLQYQPSISNVVAIFKCLVCYTNEHSLCDCMDSLSC